MRVSQLIYFITELV